jgi:hypothetical protein
MDNSVRKVITAISTYGAEQNFTIVFPEKANDEDYANFIVIDEELEQIYIGTKQDYLKSKDLIELDHE